MLNLFPRLYKILFASSYFRLYSYLDGVYVLIVLISYPIQFLVPVDIAVSYFEDNLSKRGLKYAEYGLRAGMAILTCKFFYDLFL